MPGGRTSCGPPGKRRCLGHDAPAPPGTPKSAIWSGPDWAYDGPRDPERMRCPGRWITPWAERVAELSLAGENLSAPIHPGALVDWPARLMEAVVLYRGEWTAARAKMAREEAAKERQQRDAAGRRGFSSRR